MVMWVLLGLLVLLGIASALLQLREKHQHSEEASEEEDAQQALKSEACNTCAAEGSGCFAERLLRHASQQEPLYFEDEELDAYKGVSPESYSNEAVEQFADVLHTMQPEEVADWLHSLSVRGIELPSPLRDEAILMLQG